MALLTKRDGLPEFCLVGVTAPGFAGLLKGWLALVGLDESRAQLLPLLFAVAAPALLYVILVRRGVMRVAAWFGANLFAISPAFLTIGRSPQESSC